MDGMRDTGASQDGDPWDPFGRPIFDDPAARGLHRVGVVDVGSNSVRLVVFDGAARSPAYFYNEKVMCGLGAGMDGSRRLNPEGRDRALAALRRFALLAEGMQIEPLTAVATAAVREAEDGPDFCAQVAEETGLKLHVIDGTDEARLAAQGVLLGWPRGEGLVSDIGGSSMELARIEGGRVRDRASSRLGPLAVMDAAGGRKGRQKVIDAALDRLAGTVEPHSRLYLVGGSWRAIAKLDMARRDWPLTVLQDYRTTPASLRETLRWMADADSEAVRREAGVSSARMTLAPYAGEVLSRLIRRFGVREVVISGYGIREGLLYEKMPHRLRARDPLIEAARHAEMMSARLPGFGRTLYHFVAPLFEGTRTDPRLIRAACLLHDVSWRSHPDYRAELCFETATRGNLGGIDHPGRVFLGLALLHRYRNARPGTRFDALVDLLSPEARAAAEVLGRAMRFGAMFSIAVPERMGTLALRRRPRRLLELRLPRHSAPLYGEVAAARFAALAKALDAETSVQLDDG